MTEASLLEMISREIPATDASVLVGIGDDCAVISPSEKKNILLKTDAVVEGIHFTSEDDLFDIGWKAFCRPISDFAAMGAFPHHALITVAAPSTWKIEKWRQLCRGMSKAAHEFSINIVGGETSRSPGPLFLSIMLTGTAGTTTVLRNGAKPGDLICVTGKLGGSFLSKRHLHFTPRLQEGQWLAAQSGVHAMMDLSDGLGSDLPRLARASTCAYTLAHEKIPCHPECTPEQAISDGEDYELLLAIDREAWPELDRAWKKQFPHLPLTAIGTMEAEGSPSTKHSSGFDHLANPDIFNNRDN